jgi:hypothetical protein
MTTLTDKPAWLSAWREAEPERAARADAKGAAAQAVADARTAARSQGASSGTGTSAKLAPLPEAASRWGQGFTEPEPWEWDGGVRREAVLDHDHNPPREVRKVGWRLCVTCSRPYWSADVTRLRMCDGCKNPHQPRVSQKPSRQ